MASYFKERYTLAVAISNLGVSLGFMVFGPVTQIILDTYGWRGTMLLLGGFNFHLVLCGALMRNKPSSSVESPYEEVSLSEEDRGGLRSEGSEEESHTEYADSESNQESCEGTSKSLCCQRLIAAMDFAVLTNLRFVLLTLGKSASLFSYGGWLVYMVAHGQFQGLTEVEASYLPTANGAGSILGMVLPPLLKQIFSKIPMSVWACLASAIVGASFLAYAFIKPFGGQMVMMCLNGVGFGALFTTVDAMIRFISTTDDRFVNILAWYSVFNSTSGLVGGIFTGS